MSQHVHVWIRSLRGGEICAGCGAPRKAKPKGSVVELIRRVRLPGVLRPFRLSLTLCLVLLAGCDPSKVRYLGLGSWAVVCPPLTTPHVTLAERTAVVTCK